MHDHDSGRRRFFGIAAMMAMAPMAAQQAFAQAKPAAPKALPKLPLDNPQAKALAYTETTKGITHKAFKPGSDCANCMLYKGAAGQAIQNMNIMFGLTETEGLWQLPVLP